MKNGNLSLPNWRSILTHKHSETKLKLKLKCKHEQLGSHCEKEHECEEASEQETVRRVLYSSYETSEDNL